MNSKYTFTDRLQMSLGFIGLSLFVWFVPHTVMEKLIGKATQYNPRTL